MRKWRVAEAWLKGKTVEERFRKRGEGLGSDKLLE